MTSRDDSAKPADYTFSMNCSFSALLTIGAIALVLGVGLSAQHDRNTHGHAEAAKIKNPVPASAESIAAGQKLYDRHCSECHGDTGKGDGMAGEGLDERPSDLTDAEWTHGASDGEIFTVIKDGAGPKSEMKPFGKKIPTRQIWDVVNFVRTLGPKTTK
jgi:mono/diheme cytochrome c family protein